MTTIIEKPQPSAFYRWLVLIFVSLAMFGNYYIYDSINPITDLLKSGLGFSDSDIGSLNTAYSIAAIVILLFSGMIVDKYGTKNTTLFFGILCTVSALVTALAPNYATMILGRVLLGLGAEPLIVAITVTLAKWFKAKQLGFAMGMNLLIARFGSWTADRSPSFASGLFDNWQDPLLLAFAVSITCVIGAVVYWFLETNAEKKYSLGEVGETDKFNIKEIFKFSKSFWLILALCVTFYSAIFPFRTFATKFFMEAHNLDRIDASGLNSFLPLASMFATPLIGLLVDYKGKRATFMMFGSLLILPVYLLMAYVDLAPLSIVVFGEYLYLPIILMGIAFSLIPAIMWPSVAYIVEEKRLGTGYAIMALIQQAGVASMNWAIGAANDFSGANVSNPDGYNLGMWMFSALGILGFIFAFFLRREELGPNGHGLEKGITSE
ncbi:MAG: MFS transporter [Melioribacteraceae bacterium]|nr:MFS transporter [Melioribacteraceae bacterium]